MLKVELIGNLGASAEIKEVNGRKFAAFRVANSEKYVNADGVTTERTTWVSCTMNFGLDRLVQYLTAGKKVYVSGTIETKVYKGQDNQYHAGISIFVRDIELLSAKPQETTEH